MSYLSLLNELDAPSRGPTTLAPPIVPGLSCAQVKALTAPQHESAVVIAGAGAGKTKLLVERVARLIKLGVPESRIAVVGFTRKSADEILHRLQIKLGQRATMPFCSTVHAMAYAVLKKENAGLKLATDSELDSVYDEIKDLEPKEFLDLSKGEKLLELHRAREMYDRSSAVGLFGQAYEEVLGERGLDDFTSLLSKASLQTRNLYDYVLVDESQDLSVLQVHFLRTVAPAAAFWYIGDPDQAIYAFRGAHSDMMSDLKKRCEGEYFLTDNYRCARSILTAANNVIKNNKRPYKIAWNPQNTKEGTVHVRSYATVSAEQEDIEAWLKTPGKERAVLARTQAQLAYYKAQGLNAFTVHEAKGLEWNEVRVLGCEEALFPHPMALPSEERRLFYVAMTRAKLSLELTFVESRSKKGTKRTLSRFIMEANLPDAAFIE